MSRIRRAASGPDRRSAGETVPAEAERLSEALSAWLDGETDESRAREMEARLRRSPALRRRLAGFRCVSAALRVDCPPDPGFLGRHRARREAASILPRWTWRQLGIRLALATGVCLVTAGVSLWRSVAGEPTAPGMPGIPAQADPAAAGDEPGLLALEGEVLGVVEGEGDAGPVPPLPSGFPDFPGLVEPEPVLLIAVGSPVPFLPEPER